MKTRFARFALLVALLVSSLSGCQTKPPTPQASPTPNSISKLLRQNLEAAPRVMGTGVQIGPADDLQVTFDQPMDQVATAKGVQVVDAQKKPVSGSLSWKDARTLVFRPQKPLSAGSAYTLKVDGAAKSAQGQALGEPASLTYQTSGQLQVTQVFPADGSTEVANSATITVMFNRPVVHLVIAERQADLVNPLEIDPPVSGRGEWVNTSLYVFHPDTLLKGGQQYQARVKAGLADASGEAGTALPEDYAWSFVVASPAIASISLNDQILDEGRIDVPLNPAFSIAFRQPMNPASVGANLHLATSSGEDAPVDLKWDEKNTQVTVKPRTLLPLETVYTLSVDVSAQDANGIGLAAGMQRHFTTVPHPAVIATEPADGMQAPAEMNFIVHFAAPMEFKSLAGKIVFSPEVDVAHHSWYSPENNTLMIFGFQPSTRYTVRFLPGMADPYGNTITTETDVTFTTQAAYPSAWLNMPMTPIYRVGSPQDFYVRYANIDTLDLSLFRLTAAQVGELQNEKFYSFTGSSADQVWSRHEVPQGGLNQTVNEKLTMSGVDGKPLQTGFYFLGLKASPIPNTNPYQDARMFAICTDNVTLKVSPGQIVAWVTDLATGQPQAGLRVQFLDSHFQKAAEGVTDANGLVQAGVNTNPENDYGDPNKNNFNGSWYALVDEPQHFAFTNSYWGSGANPDAFGPFDQVYRPWTDATSYIYTERPLYRPGQTVYFKGIVRADDDLAYSLPAQKQVEVEIDSFQGQVYKETLPLSDMGTYAGQLDLASEAALGAYFVQVRWPGAQSLLGSVNFDVAEYRRPEFQLTTGAAPKNVLPGDAFTASLEAAYYSGGGLSNAKVNWTLTSAPFTFTPPADYSRFSFSDAEMDNWDYYRNQPGQGATEQIAQGEGQTGPDGKASFTLQAQPVENGGSRKLTYEATVTDFAGSSVSGQAQVVMHTGAIYPGIRAKAYVGNVGDEQSFEVTALDWDGKPQPDSTVDVQIVEREWYSVQEEGDNGQLTWKTTVQETPAAQINGVKLDDKAMATVTFKPEKGGVYRARVTAHDAHGNPGYASSYLWVAGSEFIPWAQSNDRSFQLVADRDSYTPGQTAEILIASPFQGEAWALVTLERGHVRKQEVLKLTSNSTLYKLPVTPDMAPDIYVSVVVVKGIDEANPRPNFKVGIARLKVATDQQTLKVSLTADKVQAAPGDKIQYTVQTAALDGTPVQAEVSLALSDLATLSLRDAYAPPLLDYFYSPRSLSVITGIGIIQNIEDYNAAISEHLNNPNGQGMGSGGGKGGGYMGVTEVRQDFPDTAFWQADLRTGADGKATVSVSLPDNLTTWRMDARAVTADTRVGQTTMDLVSSKALLIRPQTPRFLVVGDQVTLGAAVHNNTVQAINAAVSLNATGVDLSSPVEQRVDVPAHGQVYVTWGASVPTGSQRADLIFTTSGGGYSDATRPILGTLDNQGIPVYRYESPETVGASGIVSDNSARLEAIDLPQDMAIQQGQLKIELAPSLAAGMTDGLTYLEDYPYDCTEQTVSRFLPNLHLQAALKATGSEDASLAENLKTQVNQALQKLYNRQNPDGGWGWWSGADSDLLTSAYATLGLVEARAAGYPINEGALTNALNYLTNNAGAVSDLAAADDLNRQAFIQYVLARAGKADPALATQLYDQRQSMAFYARAFLMQTLFNIDPQDARLKTLISDLASASILSASGAHWEEKAPDYRNWNTDLRTTAIVLGALIQVDPQNSLAANAVRWLMANRSDGHWAGTQETAWTLVALTGWVTTTDDLKPDYTYGVAFNGNELAQGTANPSTVRETKSLTVDVTQMLGDAANKLIFARDGSAGSLYYTAHLNLWLPVNQVQALDRGIVISRQYFRQDDLTHPVTDAKQGDVLLARLTVVAPNTLHYLIVDDPLPAGMEAVDTSLNTSPKATAPEMYDWTRLETDGYGWWYFTHTEMRDASVVLSTDNLPPGTYVYTYLVRASTPGTFNVIPPTAQESYFPEVYGRGDGSTFTVKP